MKRYIKHLIILAITIASVIPNAFAEVDIARSFYILRNDSAANAFVEGGEWLIEFSNKDTLGYEYDYPVAMNFRGAYYPDTTFVPMQAVDSVQFEQPSTIMKPGVFELTEEHYKYIIDADYENTVRFRIDCIAKIDLPKVGQKVISYIFEEPLPLGFLGQVESIKVSYDEGSILMTYKPIRLSDVYDRLYVASVIGQEPESADTVPEVVSRSSSLRPLDYDYNDEIDIIADIPLPLGDVGIVLNYEKGKFEWSSSPKSNKSPLKLYAVDNTLGVKVYEAIIIDSDNNEDYTETLVELSLQSTLGAAADFADGANNIFFDKNPLEYRKSFAPTITKEMYLDKGETLGEAGGIIKHFPNHPAAYCRIDWGIMLKAAIDIQLKLEDTFKVTAKFGYKDTGNLTPVLSVLWPDKLEFNNLNFDFSLATALQLKGGLYGMVKFGIPSIIDLSAEVCGGINIAGSEHHDANNYTEDDLDAKESTLSDLKYQLEAINRDNYFKVQVGTMFDGKVNVFKGYLLSESWVDWLRKVDEIDRFLNFALLTLVNYECYPSYEFTNISNDNAFGGYFTSKKRYMKDHQLGLLFKDASLADEDPSYVDLKYLEEMTDGDPAHCGFTIFKDDKKHLKGKPLKVYSIIKDNDKSETEGRICSTGKIAEFEFPYESNVSNVIGDDYTYVAVDIEVDPDAAEDEDYTQSGILVWKDGKKEETGIRLIGNENYAVNATILFDRKMFSDYRNDIKSNMDYCVKPWVYDAKRDRYVYGSQSKFNLKSLGGPKTLPATDITYNSALIHGKIHEEFFNYFTEDFKFYFSYWVPGVTNETVITVDSKEYPNLKTTLEFFKQITGLIPNTEYEYRVGLTLSDGKFYGGESMKFKTKPAISNLRHEAGTTFSVLKADVQADYLVDKCKNVYFEIVEAKHGSFNNTTQSVPVENYDLSINSDGTITVIGNTPLILPGTEYMYRLVLVDLSDSKVYSEANRFTTTSVISNLKADAGSDFASLSVDVSADYLELECVDVHFEVVETRQGKFDNTTIKSIDEDELFTKNANGTYTINAIFANLSAGTNYNYRFAFKDRLGNVGYSEIGTFTTGNRDLKAYTKDNAVNGNVAIIKGSLSIDLWALLESQGVKKVYFGYSRNSDMSNKTVVEVDLNSINYSTTLTYLSYSSTYYYYFYAIDADNNEYKGEILSFNTGFSPVNTPETCFTFSVDVEDADVTMIGGVPPITLSSIRTGFYRNIVYGFEVVEDLKDFTGTKPTFVTSEIDLESGLFTISKVLQPKTTYHIRAMVFFNDRWVHSPESIKITTADFDPNLKPPEIGKK